MQRIDKWKLNKDGVIAQRKMIFKKESDNSSKEKRTRQEPMTIPDLRHVFDWCKAMEKKAHKTKSNKEKQIEINKLDSDMGQFIAKIRD